MGSERTYRIPTRREALRGGELIAGGMLSGCAGQGVNGAIES